MKTTGERFERAVEIMHRLRAPGGCPWDREQTFDSITKYTVEETYEVLEAIAQRDWEELPGELGDLLLQVLFYAEMAGEAGHFSIDTVLETLSEKLVRRHPHVFGEVQAATSQEVLKNWEAIKQQERAEKAGTRRGLGDGYGPTDGPPVADAGGYGPTDGPPVADAGGYGPTDGPPVADAGGYGPTDGPPVADAGGYGPTDGPPVADARPLLDSVKSAMPALLEGLKLSKKAAQVGFDWPSIEGLFDKLQEEAGELRREVERIPAPGPQPAGHQPVGQGTAETTGGAVSPGAGGYAATDAAPAAGAGAELHGRLQDEVGDLLFTVVNLARYLAVDPELALRQTNRKFRRRFGQVEQGLRKAGKELGEASLEEMERHWQESKGRE
jgi:uncharacterized protein YabN with tetrapyrrole methylase and pyrophosphatase domain